MRAARAAAARGEADDGVTGGRSSKLYYAKPRTRGSPPNHRLSRPTVRLPSDPDELGSRRQANPTPKQKHAVKGSANKRSRVHMRVTAARGPAGGQSDADSRFPMPYPGVDRAPTQLRHHQHHFGQRRSSKRAITDHSGPRRVHTIENYNHGSAAVRKLRTRPRSAMALPLSQTGGSASAGGVERQQRPPPKSKRKQDVSKAAMVGERDQRGGSKRPRPASAPPARGVYGRHEAASAPPARGVYHRHEEQRGNKSEAGVLLALSRMADGSSCASGELRVMKWVVLRETYLTKLQGVVSADRKRAKSDRRRPSPKLFALLIELLTVLRRITVEIVEAVENWRRRDKARPFVWGSSNYLVKAAGDIEFLSLLPGLEEHLGVVVTDNPFLTHTGLDGRSTVLDRASIRSRAGKYPLGTSDSFGVSPERVAAAAAVLYREVQRARRGGGGGRGREEGLRPCSDERPRVDRSSSNPRHRLASSRGRRSPARSGSDRRPGASRDRANISRPGDSRRRHQQHSDAAAAIVSRRELSPPGDDRNPDCRNGVRYREDHRRKEQFVFGGEEERHREEEPHFCHLGGHSGRVNQPARRRSSAGPELTEVRNSSRHSQGASRLLATTSAAADDPPTPEERNFDGRRRDSSSQTAFRRRSSAASELIEPGPDYRYTQQTPDGGPRSGAPRVTEQGTQDGERTNRDNRRATEVWHTRNAPADGGQRRASQYERRRSTGSGDSRYAQQGARSPLLYYAAAVAGNDDEESRALPPDDQSVDYQNGGVEYRDDYYYEQVDAGDAYHDDEQNLDYYYEQQGGGYDAYADVEPQAGYAAHTVTEENERFSSRGSPDGDQADDPDQRSLDERGYADYGPAPTAYEDGAGAGNDTSAQPIDGLAGPPLEPATSKAHHQQQSNHTAEPAVVEATEALLPEATEEARSSDDPDPQDGNHGRMGRRGSPFNLIFNMCDGMLTDLKGLGDRLDGGGGDDTYEFEPMLLGDLAGMCDRSDGLETFAAGGMDDTQEEGKGGACVPLAQADAKQNAATREDAVGGVQAKSPPPKLRGATYASLTRGIVAMSREGGPKRKKGSSDDDGESGVENSNRIVTASFFAWAERTRGRLRHRDTKAEQHYRLHRLRHAMSAWETHRAKYLGERMAEAFAGCFGLSSRFFVRFTFDALRTHAKGARLASRNRTAMSKLTSHLERFGMARLRQAWRRWAPPKLEPEYWRAEHKEALKTLCRHWGRGRLRGALGTWRQSTSEPARSTLHTVGSFAALKGKLKAVSGRKTSKSPQATGMRQGSRQEEKSITTGTANGTEEDSWAEWMANEASVSVVSPGGERASLRAVPEASSSNSNRVVADGEQALSSSRSFRGLGAALKSIKSFRDGRDKSQARPTPSSGSPPLRSAASSPALAPPPSWSPVATNAAIDVVERLQMQHFAANTAKLRGEAAKLQSRELAAATIQRALWRAPRERQVAARVDNSARLIQRMVRLRSRRLRAGLRLVHAWRARVRARIATLDRALVEAAGEGDLRAVAFLLRPGAASGMKQGVGVGMCTGSGGGGADANATAGKEGGTALHAAASAGSTGRSHHAPVTTVAESRDEDADGDGTSTAMLVTPTANISGTTGNHVGLLHENERRSGGNWLRGKENSPNWVGVIQALVQAGAIIEARDRRGFTPMMTAAAEGSRETVAILATLGAELDTQEMRGGRRTPLVLAAQEANVQAAAALLEYGARPNFTVGDRLTPLHEAVGAGSIAVAEMLVRVGANVNATNESGGMTPLHLAVANGQHAAARLLVHSGANVCLPDARDLTCLRLTVEMADAPTVALLLAAEPPADLSVKDENGGTVLHAACRLGLTDIAQLLLEHGADPHVRDARGRTAELVALDLGHVDCAGLFYNVEIRSYTPNRTDSGGSSEDDESAAGKARERDYDESRSESDDDDDARAGGDPGDYLYQRDGEAGGAGARAATSLRQGFDEAVAAARRASSLSVQQPEEGQADQRHPRASGSSFASGEGVTQEDEEEEGPRQGQQTQGYTGGYAKRGGNAEHYTEGYDGEGNANAQGERADWKWSETEGWIRGRDGGSDAPAGTQALNEQQHDRTAAENFGGGDDEGYPGEGYKGPRQSESYSDWQQPYYPTAQGDSHGGSYDGADQEDHQQQQFHSDQGGDGSYDTADGVHNDDNPRQDQRRADDSFERTSWAGVDRGDPAELLQEDTDVAVGGDDNRHLFEAALDEGWALAEKADEEGRSAVATANHDSAKGDDSNDTDREQDSATAAAIRGNSENGSDRGAYSSSPGWDGVAAVAKASNRWMSLLDRSSGNLYYQNEGSGHTEWDLPEGAVVVSGTPEENA